MRHSYPKKFYLSKALKTLKFFLSRLILLGVSSLLVLILSSCNNKKGLVEIEGISPPAPTSAPTTVNSNSQSQCPQDQVANPTNNPSTSTTPGLTRVYASNFRISNASNMYQMLLENCRRCGTKRWVQGSYGQIEYQRLWTGPEAPQRCKNWLQEGYLQIEFLSQSLPTKAKVLILPKYTGSLPRFSWTGEQKDWDDKDAFEVTATATAINEDQGFEIVINPIDGIDGNYPLTITSNNNSPIHTNKLQINIKYGPQQQTISSPQLTEYLQRVVCKPQYTCQQYTN